MAKMQDDFGDKASGDNQGQLLWSMLVARAGEYLSNIEDMPFGNALMCLRELQLKIKEVEQNNEGLFPVYSLDKVQEAKLDEICIKIRQAKKLHGITDNMLKDFVLPAIDLSGRPTAKPVFNPTTAGLRRPSPTK